MVTTLAQEIHEAEVLDQRCRMVAHIMATIQRGQRWPWPYRMPVEHRLHEAIRDMIHTLHKED